MDSNGMADLENIRKRLVMMEEFIIMDLFKRSIYRTNGTIYLNASDGGIFIPDFDGSYMDWLMIKIEHDYAEAGRYEDPVEMPFFPNPPEPIAIRKKPENNLMPNDINMTSRIRRAYLGAIQDICKQGDDGEHGSAAVCDIETMQDISTRVHTGFFVAESKFRQKPEAYIKLAEAGDEEGIVGMITDSEVESEIAERVSTKGRRYGIKPEFISHFYMDGIIPITKELEKEYLMLRGKNPELVSK